MDDVRPPPDVPDIDSTNPMQRVAAENMAVDTPIQGSAADIIEGVMLEVHAQLERGHFETRLLLQVHDELVFDVPKHELDAVQPVVRQAMASAADGCAARGVDGPRPELAGRAPSAPAPLGSAGGLIRIPFTP